MRPQHPISQEPFGKEYAARNPLPAYKVGRSMKTLVWWTCESCGHEWQSTPFNRFSGKGSCPACKAAEQEKKRIEKQEFQRAEAEAKKAIRAREKEAKKQQHKHIVEQRRIARLRHEGKALDQYAPHLIAEIADETVDPTVISAFSDKKLRWKCEHGHEWEASIRDRVRKNSGCPYCAGRKAMSGSTDLATLAPALAVELCDSRFSAQELTASSNRKPVWECSICGHQWRATVNDRYNKNYGCPHCSKAGTSRLEDEVYEYVASLCPGEAIERRNRELLGGKEVDILLPGKEIAIEVNGLFWHSERHVERNSHKEKLDLLRDLGYRLIVVWEDDWKYRRNAIENILKNAVSSMPRVGARKCSLSTVSKTEADAFYNQWHIQGKTQYSFTQGLYLEGELVMCMSFRSRGGATGEWELVRMASSTPVMGGASKLFTSALPLLRQRGGKRVISFSDDSLFTGESYEAMGFAFNGKLKPDYQYVFEKNPNIRHHKFKFRKQRFQTNPELFFEEGRTERQLALMNGLVRVWDYGKTRFVINL